MIVSGLNFVLERIMIKDAEKCFHYIEAFLNDTHKETLCFTQFITRMAASSLFHMFT